MGRQEKAAHERIAGEAAEWVVRLADSDAAAGQCGAFEAWRGQSPRHEVAYERAAAAWGRLDRLRALSQGEAWPDADLLAPARPAVRPWAFASRPMRWAAAAAGVVATVGGGLAVNAWAFPAYATGVGERRLVVLDDGVQAELNTDTKIVVRFRHGRREVIVVRGEVLFRIAHGHNPFVVRAERASVEARQAEVDVRLKDRVADIVMRQGAATVTADDNAPVLRLVSNTGVETGPGGVSTRAMPTMEVDRVLAWRQGAIELSGQTLAQAVEEFNRYNRRQLVVADPAIAGLRLAGYFQCDDLTAFVNAVTTGFPVRASQGDPDRIVLSELRREN